MDFQNFIIQETLGDRFKNGIIPFLEEEEQQFNIEKEEDQGIIIEDSIIIIKDLDMEALEEDSDLEETDINYENNYQNILYNIKIIDYNKYKNLIE